MKYIKLEDAIWLGYTDSREKILKYLTLDYSKKGLFEYEEDERLFPMGEDFSIRWYDDDACNFIVDERCKMSPEELIYKTVCGLYDEKEIIPEEHTKKINKLFKNIKKDIKVNCCIYLGDYTYDNRVKKVYNPYYGDFYFLGNIIVKSFY